MTLTGDVNAWTLFVQQSPVAYRYLQNGKNQRRPTFLLRRIGTVCGKLVTPLFNKKKSSPNDWEDTLAVSSGSFLTTAINMHWMRPHGSKVAERNSWETRTLLWKAEFKTLQRKSGWSGNGRAPNLRTVVGTCEVCLYHNHEVVIHLVYTCSLASPQLGVIAFIATLCSCREYCALRLLFHYLMLLRELLLIYRAFAATSLISLRKCITSDAYSHCSALYLFCSDVSPALIPHRCLGTPSSTTSHHLLFAICGCKAVFTWQTFTQLNSWRPPGQAKATAERPGCFFPFNSREIIDCLFKNKFGLVDFIGYLGSS